jgi:peptidyl-dipeptidase A
MKLSTLGLWLLLLPACASQPSDEATAARAEARAFLERYSATYVKLYTASSEAQWSSQTHIVEGDTTNAERTQAAEEATAAFTGSVANIETARRLLAQREMLEPIQAKQLEAVLFKAAASPQTLPELVKERIRAETAQVEKLYGFAFQLEGKELSANDIDNGLKSERDLTRRRAIWESSKEVGIGLRPGLVELRRLRNEVVRGLGYRDYFSYMVSEYGMTTEEMASTIEQINRDLRPLYRELHTWARHRLAERYGQPVPEQIPAHWLPNRWGQDWSNLVDVQGFDLDAALAQKSPEWLVQQAERFYTSLGFESLPQVFWERSSLYPLAPDAAWKKNTHASAWHMDLEHDVRSLMSVEPNAEWYETTHHELGHIYYYLSYTNPRVPPLLREGANRAYHEAVGSLMGLAAMQPRFVRSIGVETGGQSADPMQLLLREALNYVVFIPWSTGTMFSFEKELYHGELAPERWNARWWELAARYQGIAPPAPRGEEFCDAATKTHINDDPAGYYDYALSFVLLFQLHQHIATEILHQDPRDTNYYGSREVGKFLQALLEPGASGDWRVMLREATGSDLSAKAMVEYFQPLLAWLREQNRGRTCTLAEL